MCNKRRRQSSCNGRKASVDSGKAVYIISPIAAIRCVQGGSRGVKG